MTLRFRPSRADWVALARSIPLLAVIAVAAGVSYRYHVLLLTQRDLVEHTYEVITTLESTLARIIDAETGQRGYVITADRAYLLPYERAVDEIPKSLAELRRLVADSPAQLRRERQLSERLLIKLAELKEAIAVRQRAGLQAAVDFVRRDDGRVEMEAVRAVIGEMRRAEGDLLTQRNAEARATERRLLLTTLACMAASLLARVGIVLMNRRAARRSRRRPSTT